MSRNLAIHMTPCFSSLAVCMMTFLQLAPTVQAEDVVKLDVSRFSAATSHWAVPGSRALLEKHGYQCDTVAHIMAAVESDLSSVRIVSLRMLTQQTGQQSKPTLMKALDDPEVTVRSVAAELLGSLGDANGLPRLKRDFAQWTERYENGIHDGNKRPSDRRVVWRTRATPVEALGIGLTLAKFGDNSAFELAAKVATKDRTGAWRQLAVRTLTEVSRNDPAVLRRQNRDPYPVLLSVAQTEKDELVLRSLTREALLMPKDARMKILDTVLNSPNSPEGIRQEVMKFREVSDRSEKKP